jgi:hypothetical protein
VFSEQQIEGFEKYWRRRKPGSSTAVHYASDVRIFYKWAQERSVDSITVHGNSLTIEAHFRKPNIDCRNAGYFPKALFGP